MSCSNHVCITVTSYCYKYLKNKSFEKQKIENVTKEARNIKFLGENFEYGVAITLSYRA